MGRKYTSQFLEIKKEWFKEHSKFHNESEKIIEKMREEGNASNSDIFKYRQMLIPHYKAIKEKHGIITTNNGFSHEYIDVYEN